MRKASVIVAFLVAGCVGANAPRPASLVGKFNDYNETITGEVRILSNERGLITARTNESKLYCEGYMQMTRPVLRCITGGGVAVLQCGGSRRLTADWGVTGCGTIAGTGADNAGARFSFVIGIEEAEAQTYLAQARAELAGKPSLDQSTRGGGSGTGFLISDDGLVVTNHHVIDGANTIEVHHGTVIYRASVVARDAANDLAVLKTEMKGRPLPLASARATVRGDEVLTLLPLVQFRGRDPESDVWQDQRNGWV